VALAWQLYGAWRLGNGGWPGVAAAWRGQPVAANKLASLRGRRNALKLRRISKAAAPKALAGGSNHGGVAAGRNQPAGGRRITQPVAPGVIERTAGRIAQPG